MICCDQCGEWFHCDCIGITEEEGNKMADDDVSFVCQQCRKLVDDNSQTEILRSGTWTDPILISSLTLLTM